MKTDFLIIGSGIAGLSLAIKLSALGKVLIITKKQKAESNTNYAQGGIASVLGSDDNFDLHIKDTLECGAGLCNADAVKKIVTEGPDRIRELVELGTNFTKDGSNYTLGREGGHSRSRIVHSKDLTGKEIERALLHQCAVNENIEIHEYFLAIDLLTGKNIKKDYRKFYSDNNNADNSKECYGIYALNVKENIVEKIIARKTILATGGLGQIYLHTTNPAIATGDGFAMGYRAGCELTNMEFVQFHPTSLYQSDVDDSSQVFLISEAVRGAGAVLRTKDGEKFMHKYDERESLAPRDIVARAIDNELKKRGDAFVYLDTSPIGVDKIKSSFPNIYNECLKHGIDITKDMIPVVPAAHYACGGIRADLNGRTCIRNLYACGEVANSGVHGANRLASNSLLEAVVFSDAIFKYIEKQFSNLENAGVKAPEELDNLHAAIFNWDESGTENNEEWILLSYNKREIKEVMSDYVGIVRNTVRLQRAHRRIKMMKEEIQDFYSKTKVSVELLELRNLVTVAYIIIKSAMMRNESRGLHYMLDYPDKDDKNFLSDTVVTRK